MLASYIRFSSGRHLIRPIDYATSLFPEGPNGFAHRHREIHQQVQGHFEPTLINEGRAHGLRALITAARPEGRSRTVPDRMALQIFRSEAAYRDIAATADAYLESGRDGLFAIGEGFDQVAKPFDGQLEMGRSYDVLQSDADWMTDNVVVRFLDGDLIYAGSYQVDFVHHLRWMREHASSIGLQSMVVRHVLRDEPNYKVGAGASVSTKVSSNELGLTPSGIANFGMWEVTNWQTAQAAQDWVDHGNWRDASQAGPSLRPDLFGIGFMSPLFNRRVEFSAQPSVQWGSAISYSFDRATAVTAEAL